MVAPDGAGSDDPMFAGGGRVGRDMVDVDWETTPLGPPATWPAPLRAVVRVVLTSRFSMWRPGAPS